MTTTTDTPLPGSAPGDATGAVTGVSVISQELPGSGGAADVLADAIDCRRAADHAERVLLVRAAQWGDVHPATEPGGAAFGDEAAESLPLVHWAAPAEFAAALGLSTGAGESLIHDALELRHRCEMTWARLLAGEVTAWRARRVAATTIGHPDDVAAYIDEHVHPIVHKVGVTKLDKLLDEAMIRLHPEERERERLAALDQRQVRMLDGVSAGGIASILIQADLKDAFDFNDTVTALAAALAAGGCEESADVRRALAIGILADPAQALALLTGTKVPAGRRKQMTIVVHLAAEAVAASQVCTCGAGDTAGKNGNARKIKKNRTAKKDQNVVFGAVGRLERGDAPVTAAMVADWAGRSDTGVVVRPVIDLADHQAVDAYEIPDRLKVQVDAIAKVCAFPYCTRPAQACDHDHNVPHGQDGATCSCNLAPLCRRHHRLKTLTAWRYQVLEVGAWLWTSPHGHRYYRDNTGTTEVTRPGDVGEHDGCLEPPPSDDTGPPDDAGPSRRAKMRDHIDARIAETEKNRGLPWLDAGFDPSDLLPWEVTKAQDPWASAYPILPNF